MMDTNCPICKKAGLPDFTRIHTICPQCSSDLKPFLLLHSISKRTSGKKHFFYYAGAIAISLVFIMLYFNSIQENKSLKAEYTSRVQTIQDSLQTNDSAIAKIQTKNTANFTLENEITIKYKVKSGDHLSKIAQFFYNDWTLYKKIETDNNLTQPYILKIGQTLNIKIKQQ